MLTQLFCFLVPWEMCSFSEGKLNKLAERSATKFVKFTQTQMARIYPKGTRMDSSNCMYLVVVVVAVVNVSHIVVYYDE